MNQTTQMITSFFNELQAAWAGFQGAASNGHLKWLAAALFAVCAFEFINGFHDTANAVATVIYTRSLRPWIAVIWSGICNFLGVILGGTAVAMGILKLLPPAILAVQQPAMSVAMVFAVLLSAISWNLGTWYFGIPASSSHTLIGSILGLGIAQASISGLPLSQGVNWTKTQEIGTALIVSPLLGFSFAAVLLLLSKLFTKNSVIHQPAPENQSPPWYIRFLLIGTSTGVSLAHGSNDGQKGVGLVMLVLIALMPEQYAIRSFTQGDEFHRLALSAQKISLALSSPSLMPESHSGSSKISISLNPIPSAVAAAASPNQEFEVVQRLVNRVKEDLEVASHTAHLTANDKLKLRSEIMSVEQKLSSLEKKHPILLKSEEWNVLQVDRKKLKNITDSVPVWVVVMIALSLGVGTMIGWKRIVFTIGNKIGKTPLSYAQGASAELVAMSTIGISSALGLPVSTTHVLSSGVAGTMMAGKSGLQLKTLRNIGIAWVLTLPVTMTLSAVLFYVFTRVI